MALANWLKDLIPTLASSRVQEWMFHRDAFVPIFMLHRVENPALGVRGHTIANLERQLSWLRRNRWDLISLETLAQRWQSGTAISPRTAVMTIDDGYLDQYQLAEWAFDRFDCPVTYFAATDFLDGKLWLWDAQLDYLFHHSRLTTLRYRPYQDTAQPELALVLGTAQTTRAAFRQVRDLLKRLPNTDIYAEVARIGGLLEVELPTTPPEAFQAMTWDQAQDLERRGHTVAPHSCSHRMLSRLPEQEARQEIAASWRRAEQCLGRAPTVFAYPNGNAEDYTAANCKTLEELGCVLAVSTRPGHAHPRMLTGTQRFQLPRFSLPDDMAHFCQYVSWIEQLKDNLRGKPLATVASGS